MLHFDIYQSTSIEPHIMGDTLISHWSYICCPISRWLTSHVKKNPRTRPCFDYRWGRWTCAWRKCPCLTKIYPWPNPLSGGDFSIWWELIWIPTGSTQKWVDISTYRASSDSSRNFHIATRDTSTYHIASTSPRSSYLSSTKGRRQVAKTSLINSTLV